jgi:hypothetical protein
VLLAVGLGLAAWQRGYFSPDSSDETSEERNARLEIERQLTTTQTAQLLGENGRPAYAKWIGAEGNMSNSPDGAFTISAQRMAMLELLPDSLAPRYSITAFVRHNEGDGWAGLYLARSKQPIDGGKSYAHWFASAQFADVGTQARLHQDAAGNDQSEFAVWCHCLPAPPSKRRLDGRVGAAIPFSPTLGAPGEWRRIEIRMDAAGITLFWGEAGKGNLLAESVSHDKINLWMMNADAGQPKFDPPTGGLWKRGGIGLIVWNGSASFKNLTISH